LFVIKAAAKIKNFNLIFQMFFDVFLKFFNFNFSPQSLFTLTPKTILKISMNSFIFAALSVSESGCKTKPNF